MLFLCMAELDFRKLLFSAYTYKSACFFSKMRGAQVNLPWLPECVPEGTSGKFASMMSFRYWHIKTWFKPHRNQGVNVTKGRPG